MELLTKQVKKDFNLYTVSDVHIGSLFCVEEKFKEVIQDIKDDKQALVYFNGDLIQGFTRNHKNWEHTSLVAGLETPIEQAEYLVELLKPIKNKIIGIGMGNHELDCMKRAGDVTKHNICKPLGVPYGGYKAKITFMNGKKFLFKALYHHGSSTINSKNRDPKKQREANENKLIDTLIQMGESDCAFMCLGHVHKILFVKPEVDLLLTSNENKIKQLYNAYDFETQTQEVIPINHRWYGCSGGFEINQKEGVISYAERAGYAPSVLGSIKLEVRKGLITDLKPIYK
jgi:UDP-2,3-diacylglucosamine pyrophosphatase LpxH